MKALIIAGIGTAPGKTTIAAGLAQMWSEKGKQVAFIKVSDAADDGDAAFMADALGAQSRHLSISEASDRAALAEHQGKDVVLVELAGDVATGTRIAAALDAALLYVIGYPQQLDTTTAAAMAQGQRERWVGVVVNGVPQSPMAATKVADGLAELSGGVAILGAVPESRALLGFCVGDLSDYLHASYLGGAHLKDGLIESLIVGANAADPTGNFFAPRSAAAVFCRVDRPDVQLGALNHPVRCLVLTGSGHVQASILNLAEDAGVAVLRVDEPTIPVLERLNGLAPQVRFRQRAKLPVAAGLLKEQLDLGTLEAALGAA